VPFETYSWKEAACVKCCRGGGRDDIRYLGVSDCSEERERRDGHPIHNPSIFLCVVEYYCTHPAVDC
jgi:hypothetical protein